MCIICIVNEIHFRCTSFAICIRFYFTSKWIWRKRQELIPKWMFEVNKNFDIIILLIFYPWIYQFHEILTRFIRYFQKYSTDIIYPILNDTSLTKKNRQADVNNLHIILSSTVHFNWNTNCHFHRVRSRRIMRIAKCNWRTVPVVQASLKKPKWQWKNKIIIKLTRILIGYPFINSNHRVILVSISSMSKNLDRMIDNHGKISRHVN